jgi:hypothetical protein
MHKIQSPVYEIFKKRNGFGPGQLHWKFLTTYIVFLHLSNLVLIISLEFCPFSTFFTDSQSHWLLSHMLHLHGHNSMVTKVTIIPYRSTPCHMEDTYPHLDSGLECSFLWPKGCSRTEALWVLNLNLKRGSCICSQSLVIWHCSIEHTWSTLLKDGKTLQESF